jgi:hypothetical protein
MKLILTEGGTGRILTAAMKSGLVLRAC